MANVTFKYESYDQWAHTDGQTVRMLDEHSSVDSLSNADQEYILL